MYLGTYLGNSIVRRTLLGILYCLYCIVRTIQYVYSRLFDDDGPSPRGGMRRTPVRAHGQRSSGNGLHSPRRPSCWEKKNGERQDPGMRLDLGSESTEIERPVACPRLASPSPFAECRCVEATSDRFDARFDGWQHTNQTKSGGQDCLLRKGAGGEDLLYSASREKTAGKNG